jgi:chromosome segregation protein
MHLKSIALKGFKSFPGRTRLEFGPGVSVVVGPNGSGKSNITDAVLWALGEQSPLAVRGQSMQDVIFAGGHGVQARSEAEVELVLDNSGGGLDMPSSEISIVRRLNRAGEGEYRLNGARCRLIDVIEVLSDTGLGKEMHSVISQGRVEAIVTSKPRDRRLLIEEAAGLGKHRKRRRRAQLKLERTQENLDRALDVEREARSRLRPLKRQAEAAELHERIERQSLESRWELARELVRARGEQLAGAERDATAARAARDEVDAALQAVAQRRELAEQTLAQRSERHDALARLVFSARTAHERSGLRLEQTRSLSAELEQRAARRRQELATLVEADTDGEQQAVDSDRVASLEQRLEQLHGEREALLERELAEFAATRDEATAAVARLELAVAERAGERDEAEQELEAARDTWRAAQRATEAARREAARVGAELAATNQFLRSHEATADGVALDGRLEVRAGYELALAAALGGRLGAAVVEDLGAGTALLDRAGADGGRALVTRATAMPVTTTAPVAGAAPAAGAERLLDLVSAPDDVLGLVTRLLDDAWVVKSLEGLAQGFAGIAVTRAGRVWFGGWGELRQLPAGGRERALEQRNRRERLIADAQRAAQDEQDALAAGRAAEQSVRDAEDALDEADARLRESDRERAEAGERQRRAEWLIEQRRSAPDQGETAVRRAQLEGELAAERRLAQRAAAERERRDLRIATLGHQNESDAALAPRAALLATALERLGETLATRVATLDSELAADRETGEGVAAELRACAAQEAELQGQLRGAGEAVTAAEVRAQQARDQAAESRSELEAVAARLGLDAEPATEPLDDEQQRTLAERIERLARRREQLGPVNPLAADEYREALEHVEGLEAQRTDLETALRELRTLIRDTDRQIAESFEQTFAAASRNFEELVEDVFPGGRGRLRLVREDSGPRPVLGGAALDGDAGTGAGAGTGAEGDCLASVAAADAELAEAEELRRAGLAPDDLLGVEIEITPAGKSMKRLSLLSGGEKSMTAIAFLFAVFLARPCPFYILDEVEAALDDLNIDRFLMLLRRYSKRAQFIVVTHQKRTMEAADWLYGVSMGGDGSSKVVSRRLPAETRLAAAEADAEADAA